MKIYDFLIKTNVMISHGEIYLGKELSAKLLYFIYFEKNNKTGKLLLSAKNQTIYCINFGNDFFSNKKLNMKNNLSLNKMIEKIKRA